MHLYTVVRWVRQGVTAVLAPAGALLLVALLAMYAVPAEALHRGLVILPAQVNLNAVIEKPILENYQVQAPQATQDATTGAVTPGSATVDLSLYLPANLTPDYIRVKVDTQAGNAKIVALDVNGNALASADIIPLAGGYEIKLPAETVQLRFENYDLNAAWSGSITVIVESGIDITMSFNQKEVTVIDGVATVDVTITINKLGTDGSLSLQVIGGSGVSGTQASSSDIRNWFSVEFFDSYDADGDNKIGKIEDDGSVTRDAFIYVTPNLQGQNITTDVIIVTTAPSGSYKVEVKMYFHENVKLESEAAQAPKLELGSVSMTVYLEQDQQQTQPAQPIAQQEEAAEEGFPWGMVAVGLVAAIALIFLFARR